MLKSAVRDSNTQRIKALVASFPELIESPDEKSLRPLHWAAEAQSLSSVACLVDLGADVTQKDAMGFTPKQMAEWHGEFRMGAYTDICLKIVERLENARTSKNA